MSNAIHQGYDNRVKYTLRNDVFRSQIIAEPIGYNDDEKEFKRSLKVHGVFTKLSNNLKFYKGSENLLGGYDYIVDVYNQQGINADILLIKEEQDPDDDTWQEAYRGFLDLSTLVTENNQASVKFNESGLNTSIKSRQSERLELGRLDTMDGDVLTELIPSKVALEGRNIFLVSQLQTDENAASPLSIQHNGGQIYQARAIPQRILGESDDSVQGPTDLFIDESGSSYDPGSTTHMFYAISDRDKTLEITFDVDYTWTSNGGNTVRLDLVTYENGLDYDFKEFQTLQTVSTNNGEINVNTQIEVELLAGESLTLSTHSTSTTDVNYTWGTLDTLIEENSFFDASQADFILPFEALERMIHIIGNEEQALLSTFLGRTDVIRDSLIYTEDGEGSLTGITNGFYIRRIPDKQLQTSYKDFEESFDGVWNSGYGIEKIGFKEFVRFEDKKYFYQKRVLITLPNQASKIKRTVAKDYFYSGLELGYKKGGGVYEEAMGLDEYNNKNTFTTIIQRITNIFSPLSTYRADSYGMEFARRKSVETNPVEDTRYDNDVWVMDLKRGSTSTFEQRLWQDDFAAEPTGVFSPDTAQNLRFSPMNLLVRRFGWWVKAGLSKYKKSYVRFSSSTGNSELTTQLTGGEEYTENTKVQVLDLENPFLLPEIIEFEHEVTTEILNQVQGKTLIDGAEVMNYYGQVEFINENNEKESGHLLELKPNKAGNWKLIKANKPTARFI